jgi:integrase
VPSGAPEPRGLDQALAVTPPKQLATPPADVAKVIAESRRQNPPALALYLRLAAITGSRRGELCAVQVLVGPGRQARLGRKSAAALDAFAGSTKGRVQTP